MSEDFEDLEGFILEKMSATRIPGFDYFTAIDDVQIFRKRK